MNVRPALYVALGLLMIVSIIELAFISATAGFLRDTAAGLFAFQYRGQREELKCEPKSLLTNQAHTVNGAAGTAFILVGIGGFLVLALRSRRNPGRFSAFLYYTWLVINVLSFLLTFASFIYVFIVTSRHRDQQIDPALAASLGGDAYPVDTWTPQGWFSAVLKLDLSDSDVRDAIQSRLRVMRGWQWNLIPFFIIHLCETSLALWDAARPSKKLAMVQTPDHWKKASAV